MRKTKIICTIGPACENEETLTAMCEAGMNVARLNFSHGTHEEHQKKIDMIKQVRDELDMPIAIMLDTKGPEYRIKTFKDGKITLKDGDSFSVTFRHSVNKSDVTEIYQRRGKEIWLTGCVYYGFGAGVAEVLEPGWTLENGENGEQQDLEVEGE